MVRWASNVEVVMNVLIHRMPVNVVYPQDPLTHRVNYYSIVCKEGCYMHSRHRDSIYLPLIGLNLQSTLNMFINTDLLI